LLTDPAEEAPMTKFEISRDDILVPAEYAKVRDDRRRQVVAVKKDRRVPIGPDVTFYFENYDTMIHQIQEMLHIEKGGDEQLEDELRAYAPLVPHGKNLVATMMIEIDDPGRRARSLYQLSGIDETVTLNFADFNVPAYAADDAERTTEDGKTSSVHFLFFDFSDAQIEAFRNPETRVILSIEQRNYQHMAVLPDATKASLASDFA
jgi:hypothetical protein